MKFYQKANFWTFVFVCTTLSLLLNAGLYWNYREQSKIIEKNAINKTNELSNTISSKLEGLLKSLTQTPKDLAAILENTSMTHEELKSSLRLLVSQNPAIYGLCPAYEPFQFDAKTKFYEPYIYKKKDSLLYVNYDTQPENYFEKDWYKQPHDANKPIWIEPYADSTAGLAVMTTYAMPFHDKAGKIKGVVAADIFLNDLQDYLSAFPVLDNGYVFLFSKQKNMLTHPNKKYPMVETMATLAKKLHQPVLTQIADSVANDKQGILHTDQIFNITNANVHYQKLSSDWGIGIILPISELYEDQILLKKKSQAFAFFGMIVLIFLSIILRSLLTARVRKKQNEELEELVQKRTVEIQNQNLELERQKNSLFEQNEELNQLNEEISAQRDSLEIMNETLEEHQNELDMQYKALEMSNSRMNESLNYAQRIQNAVLSSSIKCLETNYDSFVLFRPREAVSGDFYWSKQIKQYSVIVAADCTGHGVPGAFLSMLGYAFLNDNVRTAELTKPDQILDSMRDMFKDSLRQTGEAGERKDGMDMSMIVIDCEKKMLYFAGANNRAYLIRENSVAIPAKDNIKTYHHKNISLIEFMGDHQPIGIHLKETPFHLTEFSLQKNDMIYLFSDGYTDQVGSDGGRKFGRERFRELLMSLFDRPSDEQKNILETNLDLWHYNKQKTQVDDILVMGLRVNG